MTSLPWAEWAHNGCTEVQDNRIRLLIAYLLCFSKSSLPGDLLSHRWKWLVSSLVKKRMAQDTVCCQEGSVSACVVTWTVRNIKLCHLHLSRVFSEWLRRWWTKEGADHSKPNQTKDVDSGRVLPFLCDCSRRCSCLAQTQGRGGHCPQVEEQLCAPEHRVRSSCTFFILQPLGCAAMLFWDMWNITWLPDCFSLQVTLKSDILSLLHLNLTLAPNIVCRMKPSSSIHRGKGSMHSWLLLSMSLPYPCPFCPLMLPNRRNAEKETQLKASAWCNGVFLGPHFGMAQLFMQSF